MAAFVHQLAHAEEDLSLMEDGEVVLWEASPMGRRVGGRHMKKAVIMISIGSMLVGFAACSMAIRQGSSQQAEAGESVGLFAFLPLLGAMASGVDAAKEAKTGVQTAQSAWKAITKPAEYAKEHSLEAVPPKSVTDHLASLQGDALFGKDDQNDGNPCPDDEEPFQNLCYRKCSSITQGKYSIRTTAFSCCERQPCSIFNSKFSSPLKLCSGMDVAGKKEGKGCPHTSGDCLLNEELLLGQCYKKCSVMTDNAFPFRIAPGMCCKYQTKLACLDPHNVKASSDFNVGGAANDAKYGATYGEVHAPIPALAEQQQSTTEPLIQALPAGAVAATRPLTAA